MYVGISLLGIGDSYNGLGHLNPPLVSFVIQCQTICQPHLGYNRWSCQKSSTTSCYGNGKNCSRDRALYILLFYNHCTSKDRSHCWGEVATQTTMEVPKWSYKKNPQNGATCGRWKGPIIELLSLGVGVEKLCSFGHQFARAPHFRSGHELVCRSIAKFATRNL